MKRILILMLAALLLVTSCGSKTPADPGTTVTEDPASVPANNGSGEEKPGDVTEPGETTEPVGAVEPGKTNDPAGSGKDIVTPAKSVEMKSPKNYEELYKLVNSYSYGYHGGMRYTDDVAVDLAVEEEAMEAPAAAPAEASFGAKNAGAVAEQSYAAESGDYSETNAQVKGIDEGDIVKTDGKYIYVLKDRRLIILSAAGENTEVLSDTEIAEDNTNDYYEYPYLYDKSVDEYGEAYESQYPTEMYVQNGTLAVIMNCSSWYSGYVDSMWRYEDHTYTLVAFYDVSDPYNPVKFAERGQDGYYQTSRLKDGKLYLMTNYYIYRYWDYEEKDYEDYVPELYDDGSRRLIAADCIVYPNQIESTNYTVITRLSMEDGAREDDLSVLGTGSTFYMSPNYLYLADTRYFEEEISRRQESVYTVTEWKSGNKTDFVKISFEGDIQVEATGSIYGSLLNQFSMDEYDGKLRVVTTDWNNGYSIYEDEEFGFRNWKYNDSKQTNGLYVFDENLNVIGALTDLAEDERVYSVRFDGEVGYFVTFRQVDPLFTVNLSDPYDPRIMSELKIPGFSNYLHPYADGLLFGLGQNADEETGRTEGMKLSMFDVSNPYDVFERDKLSLDLTYSEALYNHKVILVAPNKGLIGFPSTNGYVLYGYSADRGFYLLHEVTINDSEWWWNSNSRGLYVGDTIYIVTSEFTVAIDMNTGDLLARVRY